MADRLAEIRARLDTGHKDRGVSCCRASQNHDRLAEIRARMADGEPTTLAGPPALVAAFVQKDEDIAWLLAEWERLTARVRIYEDVKS